MSESVKWLSLLFLLKSFKSFEVSGGLVWFACQVPDFYE